MSISHEDENNANCNHNIHIWYKYQYKSKVHIQNHPVFDQFYFEYISFFLSDSRLNFLNKTVFNLNISF